ncbi:hypothetical protein JB92DRAFT_2952842 [Gautieria morchelliformis]|nr:hypothetical protein JB92DRAFT_2952842 [Gautieria morchelliformis]
MSSGYYRAKRVHLGIALAVLSHKPPDQSLPAYLIDLKALFPLAPTDQQSLNHGVSHNGRRVPDEEDPWRQRALELEKENELLKLRAQKHELETLALKTAPTPLDDSSADVQSSQPPKKKRKLAPKTLSDRLDLRTLVSDLRSGPSLPALKDSLDILTSFRTIQQSDANCLGETAQAILILNIKRSLAALENLLTAVIARGPSVVPISSRVDVASCLCNLLLSLLNSTLPLGPQHSILPQILGELTMRIIRPIIRGFHIISVHGFASIGLKESSRRSAPPDIRPDLLSIMRRLIDCLRALKERTRELREFIIFETVKEIESLWTIATDTESTTPEHTRQRRVGKLARKDSLWYHCSVLHVALDLLPPATTHESGTQSLLSSAAVQVLAGIIHHFDSQTPPDIVARGMMLAVVEKAWLSSLYGSCTEGEGAM